MNDNNTELVFKKNTAILRASTTKGITITTGNATVKLNPDDVIAAIRRIRRQNK